MAANALAACQIDVRLDFGDLLDRQVGRLFAFSVCRERHGCWADLFPCEEERHEPYQSCLGEPWVSRVCNMLIASVGATEA